MNRLRLAVAMSLATSIGAMAQAAWANDIAGDAVADTASAPASANEGIDIVVTATRREQRQQDIPIAVTAYSAEEVQKSGFKSPSDLQFMAPGVQVSASGGVGFNVRGVGTNSFNSATEQTVGMVVDGVVYGFVDDIGGDLSDVSRVEILRGPQGTQFGKNASAGVVNIVTERPSTDSLYTVGHLAYGTHNDTNASVRTNVPLGENLAGMLVGSFQNRDGWVWNAQTRKHVGDSRQYGVKGKLKWDPTSDLDLYLSVDYRHAKGSPNFLSTYRVLGVGAGSTPTGFGIADYGITASPTNTETAYSARTQRITETGGASLEANYKLGDYTLTSLSSYREMHKDTLPTLGLAPIIFAAGSSRLRSNQTSQELRLTSPAGQFVEFVGGLYYYRRHSNDDSLMAGTFGRSQDVLDETYGEGARVSSSGGMDHSSYTIKSLAAYADGTVNVTSKLHVILGGRVTHDAVRASLYTTAVEGVYPLGGTMHAPGSAHARNDDFSWRAGLKYEVTSDIMAYATASRGYKGPLAIAVAGSSARIVDPETVRALEAGIKTMWFDKKVLVNLTAYREKFRNFQTSVLDTSLTPSQFVLGNAGGMRSQGIELETSFKPTHSLMLTVNGAYQDAKYTDFKASCYSANEPIGLPTTTNPDASGACYTQPDGVKYYQAAGKPIPNASKWNLTVAANYSHPITDTLVVDANVNYMHRSSFYTNGADPNTKVDGYGIANLNLGIGSQDGSWRVGAFARNLFNKYFVSAIETGIFDDGALVNVINPEAKRTIGVMLDGRF